MRRAGVLIALFLCASACSGRFVRSTTTEPPASTKTVGSALAAGLPKTPIPAAAAHPVPTGATAFTLTITDGNGLHPPGIPVQISGAFTGTELTDATGRIKLTRAGVYHFTVSPGCGSVYQILSGATGTAGVVGGQSSSGDLRIDWKRRYVPSAPVFSDPGAPWPIASNITLRYAVTDRCKNAFAPNATVGPLVFSTSTNLRVVGTPVFHSDAKHMASLVVECLYKGDVTLKATDKYNPKDVFDLVLDSADYEQPRCA